MTDKRSNDADDDEVPGTEIPGKLKDEMHHGAAAVTDMGEYALSDAEQIALGMDELEPSGEIDEGDERPSET